MPRSPKRRLLLVALVALFIAGCDFGASGRSTEMAEFERTAQEHAATAAETGATRFLFDDFNGLSTDTLEASAVPWKVAATVLVLHNHPDQPPTQEALRSQLQRYGLFVPTAVANWPTTDSPDFTRPMGLVSGPVERRLPAIEIEVATIGCASCHAGTLYDASGTPTRAAWLGLPNTSLDLDAYADAVLAGLRAHRDRRDEVLAAIPVLFPDTRERELKTLRRFVWPRLVKRLDELAGGDALPFRNGGPGRSNGIDALRLRLGAPVLDAGDAATVSIPGLADRSLRSALLVDGLYAPKGAPRFSAHERAGEHASASAQSRIVGFFTVSTMGVAHGQAPESMPRVAEALAFLDTHAGPPPFPGPVDEALAARGGEVYAQRCASCHGDYEEVDGRLRLQRFPNRLATLAEIGSDPGRAVAVDADLIARIEASTLGDYLDAEATGGYVAPILSGAWATAPYLHNGSVPTLWHLLNPAQRPQRFQVGGHALDLDRIGIAGVAEGDTWRYADGYRPWSDPQWFDTALPGRDRRGHETEVAGLDAEMQSALLEYLKRL
jgi:mono/diheme cytochrome c family protein